MVNECVYLFAAKDSNSFMNASATLSNQFESKYCRVLCNNDGSSTMIQAIPGRTVFQALSKIFNKKNVPWYKCDLYFVGDYQVSFVVCCFVRE